MKLIWIMAALILFTSCVPIGKEEHSFFIDNYTDCKYKCMNDYTNYNCSKYVYEWVEVNKTGNCTCSVGGCLI